MKLTEKQKRFADYYIETGNATEAAVKAGYSQKTAKEIASENLTKPNIRLYIDERIAEKDSKRIADQNEVLEFLTKVLRGEETERIPISGKDWFELVDNTPSIKDRTKAAELIGKRFVMWTDKTDISMTGELEINVSLSDDDES